MIKFLQKMLYYGTIFPPIISTIKVYIQATQELAKQLRALNEAMAMEDRFNEDNSDDE